MCGIALVLEALQQHQAPSSSFGAAFEQEIARQLARRGPDHSAQVPLLDGAEAPDARWSCVAFAAVLHLRGDRLAPQPAVDPRGNALCWNGEVFSGALDTHESDTEQLTAQLLRASEAEDADVAALAVLNAVHGPFAFVWAHHTARRVYFGHDRFGRRSLLYHCANSAGERREVLAELAADDASSSLSPGRKRVHLSRADLARLCLSSVAIAAADASGRAVEFDEVPASGIFVLDFSGPAAGCTLEFHPYAPLDVAAASLPHDKYACGLPPASSLSATDLERAANGLLVVLSNAVGVRVRSIPTAARRLSGHARVAILFSGGLDSVVIAALTHFHVPAHEPIDLLNVCFDAASGFQSPDRLAAEISFAELQQLFPARAWTFVRVDVPFDDVLAQQRDIFELMTPCDTHMDFNIGTAFWFLSRAQGQRSAHNAAVASGVQLDDLNAFLVRDEAAAAGYRALEAAIGALQLAQVGDDVDDASSSIECPLRTCKRKKKPGCVFGVCRLCCLKAQKLLRKILRDRTHPAEKLKSAQSLLAMGIVSSDEQLQDLLGVFARSEQQVSEEDHEQQQQQQQGGRVPACRVHRQRTHPSASCKRVAQQSSALRDSPEPGEREPYISSARVLLVGIGADEQLGGYGRHKTAFVTGGAQALRDELAMDMKRIWKRNLGRDDRCISAHGKEARFPFLDEDVVAFVRSLPVESLCDFAQARGAGDKLVLRVAGRQLGLRNCTGLAKRAIQFGTRIAKHSNTVAFGSNRQATGDAKFHLTPAS